MQRVDGSSDDFGNGSVVSAVLAHAGLDPMPDTSEAEIALQTPSGADCEAVQATRYAVSSSDVIRITLSDDCRPLAALVMAPAEIIALIDRFKKIVRVSRANSQGTFSFIAHPDFDKSTAAA